MWRGKFNQPPSNEVSLIKKSVDCLEDLVITRFYDILILWSWSTNDATAFCIALLIAVLFVFFFVFFPSCCARSLHEPLTQRTSICACVCCRVYVSCAPACVTCVSFVHGMFLHVPHEGRCSDPASPHPTSKWGAGWNVTLHHIRGHVKTHLLPDSRKRINASEVTVGFRGWEWWVSHLSDLFISRMRVGVCGSVSNPSPGITRGQHDSRFNLSLGTCTSPQFWSTRKVQLKNTVWLT